MTEFLIVLVGGIAIIGYNVVRIARRGFEMRELALEGVEAVGRVTEKPFFRSQRTVSKTKMLVYSYTDANGSAHSHRSVVPDRVWEAHAEGGPIEIVYSRKRPAVSAPRYLVDEARQALARRAS